MKEHDPEREKLERNSCKMRSKPLSMHSLLPLNSYNILYLPFAMVTEYLYLQTVFSIASPPSLLIISYCQMGRPPCCDRTNVKRGLWTAEEDAKILAYVASHGVGNWTLVPQKAGLNRCGKSCRLRWTNYLRPDLKHEGFTPEEEDYIIELHKAVGSRWSLIAKQLPGRTDNDVKNYWNTKLKKKLVNMGIDPITHKPISRVVTDCHNIINFTTQTSSYNKRKLIRDHHQQQQQTMPSSDLLSFIAPSTYLADFNYQPVMQPPLYVPQSPTASSSSSCTVSQQQPVVECFPGTNSVNAAQSSSFSWIDHVLHDTVVSLNEDTCFTTSNIVQERFSNMSLVSAAHGANSNLFEGCSSSSSSFVDSILDRDLEIMSDYPRLLDESCEY